MSAPRRGAWVGYIAAGAIFGTVLVKSEAVSWFRLQEMLRFQSFHMYGVIASAIATAALALALLRRSGRPSLGGEPIHVPPKRFDVGTRYLVGGVCFGLGWGLVGACPGPFFVLVGSGMSVMLVPLASAMCGTWVYGVLRSRLPH